MKPPRITTRRSLIASAVVGVAIFGAWVTQKRQNDPEPEINGPALSEKPSTLSVVNPSEESPIPDGPVATDINPDDRPIDVSLIRLIANPDLFHGKLVRIEGFLHVEFEGTALYLSRDDANYLITGNSIWLSFGRPLGKKSQANRKFVLVEGVFDRTIVGHKGMWSGGLYRIQRVMELTKFYND